MIDLNLYQEEFAEWQKRNFSNYDLSDMIHGISEEGGELNHAYLKWKQGIRGMTLEVATEKMADAIADHLVFGMQALTMLGLDVETVLEKTFTEVLKRDWKNYPNSKP